MTLFIAPLYSCALRRSLLLVWRHPSRKLLGFLLGLLVSVPAFAAEGTDVSTDEFYSDDVTVTTWDGEPLDINGDGFVDLAVASNSAAVESRWYPGNGEGAFGAPVLLRIGSSSEIVGAHLNSDTFIDLVQGRRDDESQFYLNDSTGVSGPDGQDVSADTDRTLAVAVGDLDNDGDLDLVTGNGHRGGEPQVNPLQENRFYLNDLIPGGATAFTGADIADDMDDSRSIALADMDGDGDLDVIAGNDETTAGSNEIYMNQFVPSGTVSFADEDVFFGPEDDQTGKILVGDLNNDDQPDIVVLNFIAPAGTAGTGSPGINRFYLNETAANGAFTLSAAADVSADTSESGGGALADFDGDGDLDIAVANLVTGGDQTARNRLYLNQFIESGDVTFVGSDISTDEHQSRELAAGDIDGDDDIDIVVANQPLPGDADSDPVPGRDRIYLNNGTQAPFAEDVPIFTSTPVVDATIDIAYAYNVTATDPEGDPITFAAPTLPEWLELTDNDDGTATLTGTPTASDVGDHAVSLEVSDGTNTATQDFTITVSETPVGNSPPEFTSTAVTAATEGEAYTYDVTATDTDSGATLTITAPTKPEWLTFTDNGDGTATLSGTPAAGDVGEHEVSLQVSDGTDTAVQDFTVTVEAAGSEPPPPEPPPDNGGGDGGGGSLDGWFLLALFGLGAAGRRRRTAGQIVAGASEPPTRGGSDESCMIAAEARPGMRSQSPTPK